jgi:hypothetical protein
MLDFSFCNQDYRLMELEDVSGISIFSEDGKDNNLCLDRSS